MLEKHLDLYEQSLQQALIEKSDFSIKADDFNKGLTHILDLLKTGVILFCNKNYNIPVFLAITALEEKAKLEIYCYNKVTLDDENSTDTPKRGILFNHKIKHRLAPSPVLTIGTRLKDEIGEEHLNQLISQARENGFTKERESSLYIDIKRDGTIIFPTEIITPLMAKEFLLFAIVVVDDGLVGYTDYSLREISPQLDMLWDKVCKRAE